MERDGDSRILLNRTTPGRARTIVLELTPEQLHAESMKLSRDGRNALGIEDPVRAGFGLFIIHLEERITTVSRQGGTLTW